MVIGGQFGIGAVVISREEECPILPNYQIISETIFRYFRAFCGKSTFQVLTTSAEQVAMQPRNVEVM
jgi:hypothetical protein